MSPSMSGEERQYRPGERVPGTEYVVVRLEAEGGHGALYLVRHHFLEKKVQMLKTLRGFEPSKDLIERLKREAQMLAAMDHPHIVSVTSGGLTDERNPRPYFVMERLKGRSLAQILPEAPEGVGVDAALKVTIEICDALEYVHTRHGVVHRDIKPDNVFLQVTPRNGSVTKLLDFGVAHIMDLESRYTKNNLFLGTPRYASPEQVMGETPTPRTDLYAVGLVLYELLLGHGPFDDAVTFATVATAHVHLDPPPFPKTRRFPDGLEELVLSLLRKKESERPKSAEWLATRLRQIKRIAELAENAVGQDLGATDLSPMQNVLTGHRAHLTEAGAPFGVPTATTLSEPASQLVPISSGSLGSLPVDSSRGGTMPESPIAYRSTLRMASPMAEAVNGVDRAAATRSLHVELPSGRQSDTESMPVAAGFVPETAANETGPAAGHDGAAGPVGHGAVPTSPTGRVPIVEGAPERQRHGMMLAVGVALGVAAVSVALYAKRPSRAPTSPSADDSTSAPSSAPTPAPNPTVPSAATPTAIPAAPATTSASTTTAAPATAAPLPPATATAASPELPHPTAPPSRRSVPAAPASPRPAPLRVPSSGL
jgi:serine/threonine protein kinase